MTHGATGEELQVPFRRIHLSDPDPGCQYLDLYDTRSVCRSVRRFCIAWLCVCMGGLGSNLNSQQQQLQQQQPTIHIHFHLNFSLSPPPFLSLQQNTTAAPRAWTRVIPIPTHA